MMISRVRSTRSVDEKCIKEGQDGRIVGTNRLVQILPVNRDVDILSSDRVGVTISAAEPTAGWAKWAKSFTLRSMTAGKGQSIKRW